MREEEIIEILNDWNLWKKEIESGIKREIYLKKILDLLESNMVVTIIGIRRAGKSFLIRQVAESIAEKIRKNNTLIVNFEDRRFGELDDSDLDKIFEVYIKNLNPDEKPYIFLDEIHRVKNWERWVRTAHELGKAKILVSGSTSHLIREELAALLTGRHLDIEIFPLSFGEFLKFKGLEISDKLDLINKKIEVKRFLDEYVEFGGFPEVVLSKNKKEILNTYFDDIITRDIVQRYRILKVDELLKLARFYLTSISSPITFNSIKKGLNLSVDTIKTFSIYLQSVYLIFFIKRFSFKFKEQEKSARKVYSIDVGLSNSVGFRFSENKGRLIENVVLVELLRRKSGSEVYYWKNGNREVDFVLKDGLNVEQLIQVTYAFSEDDVRDREIKALDKAGKELNCDNLTCITWDYEDEWEGGIRFTPLWKWLLQ